MAGHSKWANIKHRKSAQDARKGVVFTGLIKKLAAAARRGGGDPSMNAELRIYIDKAKEANVPKDNVERAILRATGQLPGQSFENLTYEGYGAGGVAYLLEVSTDNRNRTVADVRHAFNKHGGNLGQDGCVAWMFKTHGVLSLDAACVPDADALMELALEHGAEELEDEGSVYTITTAPEAFAAMRGALVAAGYTDFLADEIPKEAETSTSPDLAAVQANLRMIEVLEDNDDVEAVYHNMDISDEVAEALEEE